MEKSEELILRRLIWLNHGCPSHVLYGDDGEMQCGSCVIDFLREPPSQIEDKLMLIRYKKIHGVKMPDSMKELLRKG